MIGSVRWLAPAFALAFLFATGSGWQSASAQIGRTPIGKPQGRSLIVKARVLAVEPALAEELGELTPRKRFERLAELVETLDAAVGDDPSAAESEAPLGIEQVGAIDRGTTFDQQLPLTLPEGELAITVLQEQPRGDLRVEIIQRDGTGEELERRIVVAPRELSVRPTRAVRAEALDETTGRWLLLEIRLP